MSSLSLWVDGLPIQSVAPVGWGALTWSHTADGGCREASWQMDLPPTYTHPSLQRGKVVRVRFGPANVWAGVLTEPDMDDGWKFTATGLSTLGGDYLAFDPSYNLSSKPDEAIDRAIADGLPWTRPTSLSNVAYVTAGGTTDDLFYLGEVLDAWATSAGKRWGVDADGIVYAVADPTTPTWYLTPGSGRFGLADDDYASDLFIRYIASGGSYATATVADTDARGRWGRREFPVDATARGIITAPTAQGIGTGLFAKGKARQGWTNGLTVSKYQLITPGGTEACLPLVKAGEMVRMFGVRDEQGQPVPYVDFVIGETSYEAGSASIGLAPVGLVARTLTDVFAVT